MTAPRRILLAPAGSPAVGGGHLMRAVALAQALSVRGAPCTLAVNTYGAAIATRFGDGVASILPIQDAGDPDALRFAVAEARPDVLVLDDYAVGAEAVTALGPGRPRVAVVDDLADRRHVCELLIDPGYGRVAADYAGLIPDACRVLTGPSYALLRKGFEAAASRPPASPDVARVFVSLGLSDVNAVTARVVERLVALAPHVGIDVALAADAPSLEPLGAFAKTNRHVTLHVDDRNVAALMRRAEVSVGAGGASTWERCALALPSLTVIVADNQRRGVEALAADGMLLACDLSAETFERDFDAAWRQLQDRTLRATLAARSAALCDGRGAERVADAILTCKTASEIAVPG